MLDPADIPRQRAKTVLTAIVAQSGGEFAGKTRLYKAFYHAHLWYFQNRPGTLTDWPIYRGPFGPAIDAGDELIRELIDDGVIAAGSRANGEVTENYYRLLIRPDDLHLTDAVMRAADHGVAKVRDRSAVDVSHETHETSREWQRRPMGTIINIYADLLTPDQFRQMEPDQAAVSTLLADALT